MFRVRSYPDCKPAVSGHYRWQGKDLVLYCHIQPRASRDEFSGLHGERLKVRLKAPPVDGKANAHLLGFLAKAFGVPRNRVSLLQGETSRAKTILIEAPVVLPEEAFAHPA